MAVPPSPEAEKALQSFIVDEGSSTVLTFTVLGASGDLAKKKIYPVLWSLFMHKLIPDDTFFVGYARSALTHEALVERLRPYLKASTDEDKARLEVFLGKLLYVQGKYDELESFQNLNTFINDKVKAAGMKVGNRVFYLALPPSVFVPVTSNLKEACMQATGGGWARVIVEKPFGRDSESFAALKAHLDSLYTEDQLFRIDHYLGKEMVQNLILLRFGNTMFNRIWNRDHIQSVVITMKEDIGTYGRGGYFDDFGIIRDVMQNHLLQVLTLVAMERPVSKSADDIRDEKVKVLKCIEPITVDDIVLGQYIGNPIPGKVDSKYGYLDDEGVPDASKTPTFATAVFKIRNERWDGVPFIIKCGKALNERKAEIRIQFKDVAADIFSNTVRNELVIRVQPNESVYLKMNVKSPGSGFEMQQTDLDLTYNQRFTGIRLPEAYERLVLEVIHGSALHFVRTDELEEAWRIFTPLLKDIDAGKVEPIKYKFGSRGPAESDAMIQKCGYHYTHYDWQSRKEAEK
eukprot:m.170384 g.170384  ORF g.170384 m.170384 type:complete len:517 (+) comp14530_c0_seq1:223-1773(+)